MESNTEPNTGPMMTTSMASVRNYITQFMLEKPLVGAASVVAAIVLLVVFLDYLHYQQQRRRLGDIPIVGDAPYLWRRLRWTENEANFLGVIQRGYNTVRDLLGLGDLSNWLKLT